MAVKPSTTSPSPPLSLMWRTNVSLSAAVVGNNTLYGLASSGKIVALRSSDGGKRWETNGTYIPSRLAVQGSRVFAYRQGEGLAYVEDQGPTALERVSLSFGASSATHMSTPIVDGDLVYVGVNQGVYVTSQTKGLQFGAVLSEITPHNVCLLGPRSIVVINGRGTPTRYRVSASSLEHVWTGANNGIEAGQFERPCISTGNRLVIGVGSDTVAYDLASGKIAWHLANVPARAFAVAGDILYAASTVAALWAVRAADGEILWQRQFIHGGQVPEVGLSVLGDYLYFGGSLPANPDGALLLAVRRSTGQLAWMSRAASRTWAAGVPITDGSRVFTFAGPHSGSMGALSGSPVVNPDHVEITPRPLLGQASQYGTGKIKVSLATQARVTIATYRELQGLGARLVDNANWSVGTHEIPWNPSGAGGYSDQNQFGHILIDVVEPSGLAYTQTLLLPVNSFPDVLGHWGRQSVEIMAYHRYVNGYPDQTFRPNGLVTRAESCSIIAKTLNLAEPSAGFKTKFVDVKNHWARDHIMALEEKGIINGFQEPDGTLTFRPAMNMTRAQEARILVRAYNVSPAGPDFTTKFTDIASHWAAGDIKALEAAQYVNGFREADGSYTYRPEQNLTRAELCTVVVRIRRLQR